jgi:polyhydroxybutyrate depolymerase
VGQSSQTIEAGGTSRTFHLYRPQGLPDGAPLVVMLHGGFGNGAQAEHSYNWDSEADNGHFLVAYPDGLVRAWNAGSCCGEPQRTNADDVGFITAMVGVIEQQMPIDRARIYVAGMSNGAMMALRLGCQTDTFAAIAPVAGTLLSDCSAARPTSVLQIHARPMTESPTTAGPEKRSRPTELHASTDHRWSPSTRPRAPSTRAGRRTRPPAGTSPPKSPDARTGAPSS